MTAGVKAVPVLDYYHRPRAAPAASAWPYLRAADGTTIDASVIPERGAPTWVAIVSGFTDGWYELTHASGRADRVMWDASKMPYLFVYGEFGGTDEEPFRDRFYTLALQPMSAIRTFAAPPFSRSRMSHHFDYSADERLDISDASCFAGASGGFGPRTVFGMNASPNDAGPWDPAGYYELKVDTNEDLVEDITWRFTFPVDSAGIQHVVVAELCGREATDRNANALNEGFFPDLAALFPPTDFFLNQIVRSVLVEAPAEVTGLRRLNYWATTAIYDQGHGWVQLQRAGGPNGTTLWNFPEGSAGININATVPTQDLAGRHGRPHPEADPATGVWGQIRDQTAVVVADGGTYNQGVHGRPTALAYGAYVADVFLPMVIPFVPGTNALWDPWQGSHNGKGLTEDAFDNATKVILNQDFVSGLTQPAKLLDCFPYLASPPES
jgi:hypothetical protein